MGNLLLMVVVGLAVGIFVISLRVAVVPSTWGP